MRLSTSDSDRGEEPFFGRALAWIAVTFAVVFGGGMATGAVYHPRPLAPDPSHLVGSEHMVVLFGNSRFEAGVNPARLAAALSKPGHRVDVQLFSGGGWDALHYYQLALLARDVLRPGRDVAVIEVAADSVNDQASGNRLGVLRPEVARWLATLPGEPLETRLDIVAGFASLYRYRTSLQSVLLARWLERVAAAVGGALSPAGLLGPPPREQPYRLVLAPGEQTLIQDVAGDQEACRMAMRRALTHRLQGLRVGGFKWAALERAIALLRDRGIAVVLVQTPISDWMRDWFSHTEGGPEFEVRLTELERRGVLVERRWPTSMSAPDRFWDDTHMKASTAAVAFTDALAARLQVALGW